MKEAAFQIGFVKVRTHKLRVVEITFLHGAFAKRGFHHFQTREIATHQNALFKLRREEGGVALFKRCACNFTLFKKNVLQSAAVQLDQLHIAVLENALHKPRTTKVASLKNASFKLAVRKRITRKREFCTFLFCEAFVFIGSHRFDDLPLLLNNASRRTMLADLMKVPSPLSSDASTETLSPAAASSQWCGRVVRWTVVAVNATCAALAFAAHHDDWPGREAYIATALGVSGATLVGVVAAMARFNIAHRRALPL